MKDNLNRSQWDNSEPTDVDRWLEIYAQDDNVFWATDTGHLMNVIDELIERIQTAKAQAWEEGLEAKFKLLEGQDSVSLTNPYLSEEDAK